MSFHAIVNEGRRRPRWWITPRLLLLLRRGAAIGALTVASSSEGSQLPETADPPVLRGGERLAWMQEAPSLEEVRRYAFALYVNEQRLSLSDPHCDPGAMPSAFECSIRLPELASGIHALRLSALLGDGESPRSDPVTVSVPFTGEVAETPLPTSPGDGLFSPGCDADRSVCYDIQPVVTLDRPVSAPATAADGRLFLIEDGHRVRVITRGRLVADPALSVPATRRLIALILEPGFVQGRGVYVAWIDVSNAGQRHLSVAKYRELDNRLGEERILISGLRLPSSGEPQVVQDYSGRLYVAVPAEVDGRTTRPDPYHGIVLRFGDDGMTPWASGQTSPVFVRGYAQPTAMVLDAAFDRIWLGGSLTNRHFALGSVNAAAADQQAASPLSLVWAQGDSGLVDLAVVPAGDANEPAHLFVLDAAGVVSRLSLGPTGLSGPAQAISVFSGAMPVGMSAGIAQDLYVVVRDGAGAHSILRLSRSASNSSRGR